MGINSKNGRYIGMKSEPSPDGNMSGIYDLKDASDALEAGNEWPTTIKYAPLEHGDDYHYEAQSKGFTLSTVGVIGTKVLDVELAFVGGILDFTTNVSTVTVTNNVGVIALHIPFLACASRSYEYTVRIMDGSNVVSESNTISIPQSHYSITAPATIAEDGVQVTATAVIYNTYVQGLEFKVVNGSPDIYGLVSTVVNNNSAPAYATVSLSIGAAVDKLLEGEEIRNIVLTYQGQIAASSGIAILDTSVPPTANSTLSASVINEGQSLTISLDLFNYNETEVDWAIDAVTGLGMPTDFAGGILSGSMVVVGSTASITLSALADLKTEGVEKFRVFFKEKGTETVFHTSDTFTINDTSIGGSEVPTGQALFTTIGTNYWTVPDGVSYVSVVCIGAGGGGIWYPSGSHQMQGGGGGGLGWRNNIPVAAGQSLTVVVGAGGVYGQYSSGSQAGTLSSFSNGSVVTYGFGGSPGRYNSEVNGGGFTGDGGGSGGSVIKYTGSSSQGAGGGGGAGGYTGGGGKGGHNRSAYFPTSGSGGGGGGGGHTNINVSCAGGGVGVYGQGANGAANNTSSGGGGSGGETGIIGNGSTTRNQGGLFGGGGGGQCGGGTLVGKGGDGAVRIIWGINRSFPSTNTQDM